MKALHVKERFAHLMGMAAVAGSVSILVWSAFAVFAGHDTRVYAENGFLENAQVWFLAAAGFIYLVSMWCDTQVEKLILLFLTLLCTGFILREVDVEDLNIDPTLAFFGYGIGRNLVLGAGCAVISVYAAFRARQYLNAVRRFLRAPAGVLLLVAGTCLIIGQAFEEFSALTHHVYFEELWEFLGYGFMVVSSLVVLSGRNYSTGPYWPQNASSATQHSD